MSAEYDRGLDPVLGGGAGKTYLQPAAAHHDAASRNDKGFVSILTCPFRMASMTDLTSASALIQVNVLPSCQSM